MSASRSAANSPHQCSSHRSAAVPSSPDGRLLGLAHLFLHMKRRTLSGPGSAPSPPRIAPNDLPVTNRATTAASLTADQSDHPQNISSCLVLCQMPRSCWVHLGWDRAHNKGSIPDRLLATNIASLFGTFSFLNAEERKTLLRKVVVAIHTTSGAISKVILRLPTDVAKLCIHTNVNAQFHNSIEVPIEPAVPFKMLPPSKLNKLRIPDRQQYFTAHAAEALGVTKDERSARLATEIYPPVRKDSRGRGVFTLKDVECLAKILNGQVEPKIKTSGERPEQEEIKEESCDTAIFSSCLLR